MKRKLGTQVMRIMAVTLVIVLLMAPMASGEQSAWDCPECGRTGNLWNYCGNCAHPAPWTKEDGFDEEKAYDAVLKRLEEMDGRINSVDFKIPQVVDNLASDSTTSALSAAQGKALNSNIRKVLYYDYEIVLTSSSGRTVSVSATITGYKLIGASFVHNDDLYYLIATDGIYPVIEIVDGNIQYIQLLGMNKQFSQVGANRAIKVRGIYTKV